MASVPKSGHGRFRPLALRPSALALVIGMHGAMVWASIPFDKAIGDPEAISVSLERETVSPQAEKAPQQAPEPIPAEVTPAQTPPEMPADAAAPPPPPPELPLPEIAQQAPIEATMALPEEKPVVVVPPPPKIAPPPRRRAEPKQLPKKEAKREARPAAPPSPTAAPAARAHGGQTGASGNDAGYAARVRSVLQARANALGFEDVNATVGLSFTIDGSGRVALSSVSKPSGDFKVDAALRRMLASASFPPPPGGKFSGSVTVRIR